MSKDMLVTIDGPTGAGKSTVGKLLAERLGIVYLDTGAMYRVVALEVQRRGINPDDQQALAVLCSELHISFKNDHGVRVYSRGEDVTGDIRTPEVSMLASRVSAQKCVRDALVRLQRDIGENGGLVVDGRDAGTVIFPHAAVKFYLDAALQERSQRRYKELIEKNMKVAYSDIQTDIAKRDQADSSRDLSPLKPAPDAVIIDTTEMSIEEVVAAMVKTIERKSSSLS